MDPRTAKSLAQKNGCELWYDTQWQSWALHRKGSLSVEGSGGCWMSPAQLRDLPRAKLLEWIQAAKDGPADE